MVKQHETVIQSELQDNPQFLEDMQKIYQDYNTGYDSNPFVSPVFRLALDINRGLENGHISFQQIQESVSTLTQSALETRAQNLAEYLGACNKEQNIATIDALFQGLSKDNTGALHDFKTFQEKTAQILYGFVFTAHPTFTMSLDLSQALSAYTAHLAGAENNASIDTLHQAASLPFSPPDLDDENSLSLYAIDNLHTVMAIMLERFFHVACTLYPDDWEMLTPKLFSLATWVGFDIDGRRDISWTTTLEKRLFLQLRQLESYQDSLTQLMTDYPDASTLQTPLDKVERSLSLLRHLHQDFATYQPENDPDFDQLQKLSRQLISSCDERLTSAAPLIEDLQNSLSATQDKDLKIQLMVVLTQLRNFGLSRADVHFRINAAQLHNAISDRIRLATHPDHPTQRRQYISEILELIDTVTPVNVDFGDIAEEEITAKYQFMLIQEITQYIDQDSPIRFLIAETESAFTVFTAYYYAKHFGVDDKIDICPLFETDQALQNSSRYMHALLDSDDFAGYLQRRGKMCIQTGYSDAGRYIGQPAAGASIERLKERFIQTLSTHERDNIGLLFFDTHGESIGRGGHPESFEKRMQYIASPYVRAQTAAGDIPYTQESSYQGGDGFLNFMTEDTALAVLTRVLEYWLADADEIAELADDPYYTEPYRSDVTALLTESTRFQLSLTRDPQYANILFAYSTHMTNPSGSRAVKRQPADHISAPVRQSVNDIRAIPTNAILGQMGLLANTVSGVGRAVREYADFATDMSQRSPRFQTLLSLIRRGAEKSDPQIMRAYINILNPTLWLTRASACPDPDRANRMAALATHLEKHDYHDGMMEIFRKIYWDYTLLQRFEPTEQSPCQSDIACLHALRLALIQYVFTLATHIPRYSPRHAVSRDDLLKMVFHMDIDNVIEVLKTVFPIRVLKDGRYDFGEKSEYRIQGDGEGYKKLQDSIISPLQDIHKTTKDISTALAHYMGFFG